MNSEGRTGVLWAIAIAVILVLWCWALGVWGGTIQMDSSSSALSQWLMPPMPPLPQGQSVIVIPPAKRLQYRVYYGPATRTYTNHADAGTNLVLEMIFGQSGLRYFTAVSVDQSGIESDWCNEVSATNTSLTLGWEAPRRTNFVPVGIVLEGGPTTGGPWTDAFVFPAFTLTNPSEVSQFYRARVTVSNY